MGVEREIAGDRFTGLRKRGGLVSPEGEFRAEGEEGTYSTPAEVSSQGSPSRLEEQRRRPGSSARGSLPVPVSKQRSRIGNSSWVLYGTKDRQGGERTREGKRRVSNKEEEEREKRNEPLQTVTIFLSNMSLYPSITS